MGFRFSRRVKLVPGVRLNVGMKGASLSLGGRGATLNLSKRGLRSTFGVPGTGLTYTSSSSSAAGATSASSATSRGTAAAERALRAAQAQALVEEAEREREAQVNAWRAMPAIPSAEDYRRATQEGPWPQAKPSQPEEASARAAFRAECEQRAKKEEPVSVLRIVFGVLVLGVSLAFANVCLAICGLIVAFIFVAPELSNLRRRRPVAQSYFSEGWPTRWVNIQANWAAYNAWPTEERERAAFAARLVAGDLSALTESLSDSLSDLEFPFEAACRVAVPEAHEAFVLLDLPEIEDVISEEKQRALKSGEVKDVRRSLRERQAEYARLVMGLGVWVARTAFAAGPTLQRVHVAAYTQRRRPGTGELVDDFVYEATFEREEASSWRPDAVDSIDVLRNVRSRFDLRADGQLKSINAPDWEKVAS